VTSHLYLALPSIGAVFGGRYISLDLVGLRLRVEKLESKAISAIGDSSKDSTEASSQRELWCLEALQGATGQDPCLQGMGEDHISWEKHLSPSSLSSKNLEVLAEKVGTLGLRDRVNRT